MAKEPTSLIGHMMAAGKQSISIVAAPVMFIVNAGIQALERLIPQGAAEIAQGLFSGSNAFVPYGPTDRQIPEVEPVARGAEQVAPAVQAPVVAPVTNRVPEKDFNTILAEAAARLPAKDQSRGMER